MSVITALYSLLLSLCVEGGRQIALLLDNKDILYIFILLFMFCFIGTLASDIKSIYLSYDLRAPCFLT